MQTMSSTFRKMSDDDILNQFHDSADPVLTAAEIADNVGMSRQAIQRRLKQLRDDGRLNKKKVGGRAIVWWLPDVGDEFSQDGLSD